jgi:hypothetical protein
MVGRWLVSKEDAMRLHKHASAHVSSAWGRVRVAGAGVVLLGAVALVIAPACLGGGGTGDYGVHVNSAAASVVVIGAADGAVAAPDCGGGGGSGDTTPV